MTGLDALAFDLRLALLALQHGGGRVYDAGRTDARTTDCSRLVYAVLIGLYGDGVAREHHALHLRADKGHGEWAPIEAVVRLGVGVSVDHPTPGRWHIVQGWTLDGQGHTFLWREPEYTWASGKGIQVQANRGVGAFLEADETWSEQTERYTGGVRLAVLEVV